MRSMGEIPPTTRTVRPTRLLPTAGCLVSILIAACSGESMIGPRTASPEGPDGREVPGAGRITDLSVLSTTSGAAQLSFTGTADDTGAVAYEVRFQRTESDWAWERARVATEGSCAGLDSVDPGHEVRCWVDGLASATEYRFQAAPFGEWQDDRWYGPRSNLVTGTTSPRPGIDDGSSDAEGPSPDDDGSVDTGSLSEGDEGSGDPGSPSGSDDGSGDPGSPSGGHDGSGTGGGGSGSPGGGSGTAGGGSGATPPPPPASGQRFSGDFSAARSDAELQAMVNVATRNNIHAEPGVGMRYDFQPFPTRCADQALSSSIGLPANTKEVWIKFRIRFSSNWRNDNPNCTSPTPAYKTVFADIDQKFAIQRFELVSGAQNQFMHVAGPGWPTLDNVPVGVVRGVGQIGGQYLYDGQWHDVALHFAIRPNGNALVQARIDGIVSHNYETSHSQSGLSSRSITKVRIGSNRNLGAVQMMHVWWDDFQVWVGSNPGGFSFGSPTSY